MKINKKILSFILFFVISFNLLSSCYSSVKANALAVPIYAGATIGEIAAGTGIVVSAPVVGALIFTGIAAGLVFKYPTEIRTFVSSCYNHLINSGNDITDNGDGTVSISSSAKSSIKEYIECIDGKNNNFTASDNINWSNIRTVAPGCDVWFDVTIPFEIAMRRYFELKGDDNYGRTKIIFQMDGVSNIIVGSYGYCSPCLLYHNRVLGDICCSSGSGRWSLPIDSYKPIRVGVRNTSDTESFTVGLVEVPRYEDLKISIPASPDVPFFKNPSLEGDKDTVISIPKDATYGKVMDKNYDDVIDIRGDDVGSVPKPGESDGVIKGLWDWLKGILQSILDAILSIPAILKNILDAILSIPSLIQQIIDFFKVDWAEVAKHTDYTGVFRTHFKPFYDITDLLTNIKSNPQSHNGKFYMKIPKEMGGDNKEHCVLDLSVGAVYIDTGRNIIKYGIWIAFLWYVLKVFSPKFNIG